METTTIPQATPNSEWAAEIRAILRETVQIQAETDRLLKESVAETDRLLKESIAETDRRRKEEDEKYEQRQAKIDRQIENVNKMVGAWSNNQGSFAEEYFYNSFIRGRQNFFGEEYDSIRRQVEGKRVFDEYDLLLVNGKSIGIIEVKYKGSKSYISNVIKKADTFRRNFPKYKNHKVYLGIASLSFSRELEQECINEGIAIIKQVGDTVIINDKHLKAY